MKIIVTNFDLFERVKVWPTRFFQQIFKHTLHPDLNFVIVGLQLLL